MSCLQIAFRIVGVAFSVFYGWYAVTIHVAKNGKLATVLTERQLKPEERHHWSWWAHQKWINLAGSALGWSAGYYLIFHQGKSRL